MIFLLPSPSNNPLLFVTSYILTQAQEKDRNNPRPLQEFFFRGGRCGDKSNHSLGTDHRDWLNPNGYTELLQAISPEVPSSLGQFFFGSSPSRFCPKNTASSCRQGLCWIGSSGEVILMEGFHIWHASAAELQSIPEALHWRCPRIRSWLDSHIEGAIELQCLKIVELSFLSNYKSDTCSL